MPDTHVSRINWAELCMKSCTYVPSRLPSGNCNSADKRCTNRRSEYNKLSGIRLCGYRTDTCHFTLQYYCTSVIWKVMYMPESFMLHWHLLRYKIRTPTINAVICTGRANKKYPPTISWRFVNGLSLCNILLEYWTFISTYICQVIVYCG